MANYYRTGTAVTTYQEIINAMLSFLTAAAPGAAWVEDATYTAAGNPGELFLATSGGTTHYIYLFAETVSGNAVLQCYWLPGAANGYGGGTGPALHETEEGCAFYCDFGNYVYTLHMFADEDRSICALKGKRRAAAPSTLDEPYEYWQILYFGAYTPADSTNDTYPQLVAGSATYAFDANTPPTDYEGRFFPEALTKAVDASDTVRGFHRYDPDFEVLLGPDFVPPRNSYGSEVLAYLQQGFTRLPGLEYAWTFTGLYVTTQDVGYEQDVTIGGDDYYSVPTLGHITADIDGNTPAAYLIPKGTVVP